MASKTRKSGRSRKPRKDPYVVITDKFVAALQEVLDGERERLPWTRPWDAASGMPRNGTSGRHYNGLNVWLLWLSGHTDPRWATSNQIMQACGFERNKGAGPKWAWKGEGEAPKERILAGEATAITYWKFLERSVTETDEDGDEQQVVRRIPMLRIFYVYNYDQVNWPEGKEPKPLTKDNLDVDPAEVYAEAATFFSATGATVEHGGGRAFYRHTTDVIGMPRKASFYSPEAYWATLAHETIHWTGHKDRCGRDLGNFFGTPAYAQEELVAELGSAFLCADLGIENRDLDDEHRAYLEHWVAKLNDDKYEVFRAARMAKEALALLKDDTAPEKKQDTSEATGETALAA